MFEAQSGSTPTTEVPQPFAPQPPKSLGGGCSRAGLVGCGVLTLALGVAAVLFLLKAGDLFSWAMERFEAEVVRALPEDFSDLERRRLGEAFAGARRAVREGEADPQALQRLQAHLRESLLRREDQRLSRQQVLELMTALEEVASGPAPESPAREATEMQGEAGS